MNFLFFIFAFRCKSCFDDRVTKRKKFSRDPTCTSVINIVCISCAISQLTGFLQCRAIFRPSWLGYWHVFSGLQYCARSWRCFGQIVNFFISSNGRLNFPTLANINSCSVTFVRDRWQLFKWFLTSATHSARCITSSFPRDSKQIMFPFPMNEHAVGLVTALAMAIAWGNIYIDSMLCCDARGQRRQRNILRFSTDDNLLVFHQSSIQIAPLYRQLRKI